MKSSKTLVEDLKKGQSKVNILNQKEKKKRTPLQKLKRAPDSYSTKQDINDATDLENLQTAEAPKGIIHK
jgi:hypothetical protein